MHKDEEDKSLAELAPSYEVASVYLVHMLEARFASLNPFMQYMFLKLHDIEDSEKKDFILETLHREFKDVVIEARKVFKHFNMLGSPVKVVGTTKEDYKVPIPCKLVGMHEALEKNFDWICPKNLFDESSVPKRDHKGSSKTHLDTIQFRDFYFRALGSLVVLSFSQLLSFSSVLSKPLSETLTSAGTAGCPMGQQL
jgi:hypothetical protein